MCGLAGVLRADPACERLRPILKTMAATMAHRGPDDEGLVTLMHHSGSVGLCARRLAIRDLGPAGHQPMHSARTGSVACFNGEVYNAESLRTELTGRGHRFAGTSDTEVVLAAYDEWGAAMCERLRGMFAIAIWDLPEQRLFLARDRLGIKPLYYVTRGPEMAFASEVRTLLRSGLSSGRLSTSGVCSFLSLGAVSEPGTIIDDILMWPAGHHGYWRDGRVTMSPYWSLDAAFAAPPNGAAGSSAGLIRRVLEDNVRQHLVSDVPLGVFLSGGVDSSSLVALAASVGAEPPVTLSLIFPEQEYSEQQFIAQIVERYTTTHHEVEVDSAYARDEIERALNAMDQPTIDGVNTYIISSMARDAGIPVVLSGLGGDELFGGYDSFRSIPRLEWARQLPRPVRQLAAAAVRWRMGNTDRGDKLNRWLRGEPPDDAYELTRELFSPGKVNELTVFEEPLAPARTPSPRTLDTNNRVSLHELGSYMRNTLLRDGDVMSMAHSVELRVPFVDHQLVEAVAMIPGRDKQKGLGPKPLLAAAVKDLVPEEILRRPKAGFVLPFAEWLRHDLREEVRDRLNGGNHSLAPVLDEREVLGVWQRFLEGKTSWSRPWALYVLMRWHEAAL